MNESIDLKLINQYKSEPWTPLPKQAYDLIRNESESETLSDLQQKELLKLNS